MSSFAGERVVNNELRICGGVYLLKGSEAISPKNLARCSSGSIQNADDKCGESACGSNGIYDNSTVFYDLCALHMRSLYLRVASQGRHN